MAGKILSKGLGGLSKKEIDLLIEFRDKEEAIEQFRILGYEVGSADLDAIKLAYERKNETSDASILSLEQLEQVAGGIRMSLVVKSVKEMEHGLAETGLVAARHHKALGDAMSRRLGKSLDEMLEAEETERSTEQDAAIANAFVSEIAAMAAEREKAGIRRNDKALKDVINAYLRAIYGAKGSNEFRLEEGYNVRLAGRIYEIESEIMNSIMGREDGESYGSTFAERSVEILALHSNRDEEGNLHFVDERDTNYRGQVLTVNTIQKHNVKFEEKSIFYIDPNKGFNTVALMDGGKEVKVDRICDSDYLFNLLDARYNESSAREGIKLINGNSDKTLLSNLVEYSGALSGAGILVEFDGALSGAGIKEGYIVRYDMLENVFSIVKAVRDREDASDELKNMASTDVLYVMEKHADQGLWNILTTRKALEEDEKNVLADFILAHAADIEARERVEREARERAEREARERAERERLERERAEREARERAEREREERKAEAIRRAEAIRQTEARRQQLVKELGVEEKIKAGEKARKELPVCTVEAEKALCAVEEAKTKMNELKTKLLKTESELREFQKAEKEVKIKLDERLAATKEKFNGPLSEREIKYISHEYDVICEKIKEESKEAICKQKKIEREIETITKEVEKAEKEVNEAKSAAKIAEAMVNKLTDIILEGAKAEMELRNRLRMQSVPENKPEISLDALDPDDPDDPFA